MQSQKIGCLSFILFGVWLLVIISFNLGFVPPFNLKEIIPNDGIRAFIGFGFVYGLPVLSALVFCISVKVSDREKENWWISNEVFKDLANLHRNGKTIGNWEGYNLCDLSKDGLVKNRVFLLEKLKLFQKYEEDFKYLRDHSTRLYNHSARILAEIHDATACIAQTMSKVENDLENVNNPTNNERRGAPPPVNQKNDSQQPKPEPNWDAQSDAEFIFNGLVLCGYTPDKARSFIRRNSEDEAWEQLSVELTAILQKHGFAAEDAREVLKLKGVKAVLKWLSGGKKQPLLLS